MTVLEVCVDSLASAKEAQAAGATRFALCGNLVLGGTSPSFALFEAVARETTLPIHVVIRPRPDNFVYSREECAIMCREISWFSAHGASGVLLGAYTPDGRPDKPQLADMMLAANGIQVTLCGAMDSGAVLEDAISLGCGSVLAGPQEDIGRLLEQAGRKISVRIGVGDGAREIAALCREFPQAEGFALMRPSVEAIRAAADILFD